MSNNLLSWFMLVIEVDVALRPRFPVGSFWVRECINRILPHLPTVTRASWNNVSTIDNRRWILEMFVEVVNIFSHPILQVPRDGNIVPNGQMLNVLTQTNTSSVRTNGNYDKVTGKLNNSYKTYLEICGPLK